MGTRSNGQQFDDEIASFGVMRAFKWGVIAIALLVALGVVGRVLGLFGTVTGAATGVVNRTLDPDNIISTYEGFHDRWKAFEARKAQIKSYAIVVEQGGQMALIEREAMRQSCREIAAQYNADSAKVNRMIFKGKSAPATLNQGECNE